MSRPYIELLHRRHDLDPFDSGVPALDAWLRQYAGQSGRADMSVTQVAHVDDVVIGYYTLVASEVAHADAPPALNRRVARHPIPVLRLARLAVDRRYQGTGLGAGLLREALHGAARAADIVGARAVVVDAKDDRAAAFYAHFEFEPFPDDPHTLFLTMRALRDLVTYEG
jgi:GNAT superfamily N-acetyltransferase